MTCRVKVTASDSSVTPARALLELDCVESISLGTEHLFQRLCFPWHHSNFIINEFAGCNFPLGGTVSFRWLEYEVGEGDQGGSFCPSQGHD